MSFDKDTYRTPLWFFRWLETRFAWLIGNQRGRKYE